MFRICDLVSIADSSKTLRKNVQERNAIEGLGIRFSDISGSWTIKRVHGFSLFAD